MYAQHGFRLLRLWSVIQIPPPMPLVELNSFIKVAIKTTSFFEKKLQSFFTAVDCR